MKVKILIKSSSPGKKAVVEKDGVLRVHLGDVLLGELDVADGVRVHRLLPAVQQFLLVVHLAELHLKTKIMLKEE